jgi:uncharacterized protein DUF3300/DUF2950 family protein
MKTSRHSFALALMITAVCGGSPLPSFSQAPLQDMPPPSAGSLDKLVAPIALYPDALVAQILPAATQPLQVVEAAVGKAGRVYEKDLGEQTDQLATEMKEYNPDGSWQLVTE